VNEKFVERDEITYKYFMTTFAVVNKDAENL